MKTQKNKHKPRNTHPQLLDRKKRFKQNRAIENQQLNIYDQISFFDGIDFENSISR